MIKTFLNLGKQPLANDFKKIRTTNFYNLSLKFDTTNCLVSINKRINKKIMFNKTYPYRSSESLTIKKHFKDLSNKIKKHYKYKKILEIGTNDGCYASNFDKKKIICIEPCLDVAKVLIKKKFKVIPEYFDKKLTKKLIIKYNKFDIVFSANTITHIDKIEEVLINIKKILSDDGIVILEEPSFLECLKKNAFDQFYNEHIYVLSAISLRNILNKIGLKIFKLEQLEVHGGSLRYYITHKNNKKFGISKSVTNQVQKEKKAGLDRFSTYLKFGNNIINLKKNLIKMLKNIKSNGNRIVGYGASAKAVTVVHYCNLQKGIFDYFVDTTKNKIGKYLPGTKIIIKNYKKSKIDKSLFYFLGAWNFKKEIFYKERNFLKKGGKFILHLPKPTIYERMKI